MSAAWVKEQWEGSNFGDSRLKDRAIKIGHACLIKRSRSLPQKCGNWADIKGAYRFFDSDKISHDTKPSDCDWVTIGDRGSDIYEFLKGAEELKWNYVVRVKHDRKVTVNSEEKQLKTWIRGIEPKAEYMLELRGRGDKPIRSLSVKVAWGEALLNPPSKKSGSSIPVTYVRAYSDEDPDLEWILVTSLEINLANDVIRVDRCISTVGLSKSIINV